MAGKNKDGEKIWFYPQDARFYEYGSAGPGAIQCASRRTLSEDAAQRYISAQALDGWEPDI
jgi:pectinesterase